MSELRVRLFGQFQMWHSDGQTYRLQVGKVQELLGYLLLHRHQSHPRETLLEVLWYDHSLTRAQKALRQTLWQLKTDLGAAASILLAEGEHVTIHPDAQLWLDVGEFESAFAQAEGKCGAEICDEMATSLSRAVDLYQDGLLSGCYEDWCLRAARRFETIYIDILGQLMEYCEARQRYREAVMYGRRLLRQDPAHELTHRRMMRAYYLLGDRTAALRQFHTCKAALHDELGVAPGQTTSELYQRICSEHFEAAPTTATEDMLLPQLLQQIREMQGTLQTLYQRVENGTWK